MKLKKNIANYITALRIAGTLLIPFFKPLSIAFFVVYTVTGATDLFDGFIARRLNISSPFGAKLDSIADLLFYTVSLLRLLPALWRMLPRVIWIIVALVLALRLCAYLVAAFRFRRFASLHTVMNKITGAAVFAIPYFLITPIAVIYCFAVCGVGLIASAEELIIHCISNEYKKAVKASAAEQRT